LQRNAAAVASFGLQGEAFAVDAQPEPNPLGPKQQQIAAEPAVAAPAGVEMVVVAFVVSAVVGLVVAVLAVGLVDAVLAVVAVLVGAVVSAVDVVVLAFVAVGADSFERPWRILKKSSPAVVSVDEVQEFVSCPSRSPAVEITSVLQSTSGAVPPWSKELGSQRHHHLRPRKG